MNTLKHYVLGLELESRAANQTERISLLSYGVLSSIYAMTLMISIPLMLASRFQVLGLLIGAIQIATTLIVVPKQLHEYLFRSVETESVRKRAQQVGYGLALGVPVILLLFPIPTGVRIDGIVSAEQSTVLRAKTPGIVLSVDSAPRTDVAANQPLLSIENEDASVASQTETSIANAALRNAHFVSRIDVAEGAKQQSVATERQTAAQTARASAEELTIRAPHSGRLSYILPGRAVGNYVVTGDPVAKLVSGKLIVRAWMDEGQLHSANLKLGSSISVRLADDASHNHSGTLLSVAPSNAAEFEDLSLTTSGEGDILIDPLTGVTTKPLFQLQIAVPSLNSENTHQEARAFLLVGRKYESIGQWLVRHTHKFVTSIFTN